MNTGKNRQSDDKNLRYRGKTSGKNGAASGTDVCNSDPTMFTWK